MRQIDHFADDPQAGGCCRLAHCTETRGVLLVAGTTEMHGPLVQRDIRRGGSFEEKQKKTVFKT